MIKDINYYRLKFSPKSKSNKEGLNVSRSAGVALNKPILLLSVIELIERSASLPRGASPLITNNRIYLSGELIATFLKFWHELEQTRKPDIGMPFFHLKSDGFWHLSANLGHEYVESASSKIKVRTVSALNQAVDYAYLDPELFFLLKNSNSRNELILVLIDSWFSDKTASLERSLSVDAFANISDELLETGFE